MHCYWAWLPRLLNKKTMWWLRMCEVRSRLACRLCTPGPWEEVQLELQSQAGRGIQGWEPALFHC